MQLNFRNRNSDKSRHHYVIYIYINLGEGHMCTTCKVYPRKNWVYGDITFVGKYI